MQKNSHVSLEGAAEALLWQIKNRTSETTSKVEHLLLSAYEDIKRSVEFHGFTMPNYKDVCDEFYCYIDKGYYSIDIVNADQDIDILLDEASGELLLRTPCSIFVGGQVLDRGVTIRNMIGFYYGRNPIKMQQDTVLQHSRMFGYRKSLLPVTRFYTTNRIHSNMERITEIDMVLREDIANGSQGNGVYFITNQLQDKMYGIGEIRPCSPDKIKVSDIILLKPHRRILPIGFSPSSKNIYQSCTTQIDKLLHEGKFIEKDIYKLSVDTAKTLISLAYETIIKDNENNEKFIEVDEFITSLKYLSSSDRDVVVCVYRNMGISKYKQDTIKLQDAPDTAKTHLVKARELAVDIPVIMLFQETGNDVSWKERSFWWPVIVAPKNVPNTLYASKVAGEKIVLI